MRKYNVSYNGFYDSRHAANGTLLVEAKNSSDAQEKAATILAQRYDNFEILNVWEA